MDNISIHFGTRFKNERIRLNLTQKELANKMDIQPLTIIQYEKGKSSPNVEFIYSLQRIGFDISYLILNKPSIASPTKQNLIPINKIAETITLLERQLDYCFTNEQKVKIMYLTLRQFNCDNSSLVTSKTLITNLINQVIL